MDAEPEDFRAIFEDGCIATEPSEDEETWNAPMDALESQKHGEDATTRYLTRARHNLQDVELEDLEKLLQEEESDLELAQGEYQKFLAALQGMEDLEDGYNEDEDADFVVSVDDLLQDGDDEELTRNIIRKANLRPEQLEAMGRKGRTAGKKRRRKDAGTRLDANQERPIDSVQRLAMKQLPPLRLKPLVPPLAPGVIHAPHIAANGSAHTLRVTAPHPAFTQDQLDVLHAQFRAHTQLTVQAYAISESCTCADHKAIAQQIRQQAQDLVEFGRAQLEKAPLEAQVCIRSPPGRNVQEQEEIQLRTICQTPALELLPGFLEEALHYAPAKSSLAQHCQIPYPSIIRPISACMDRFAPFFEEGFRVNYPNRKESTKLLFTSGEDLLLAKGIDRFGMNWEMIQQIFLPTKTARQVFIRQKNRSASRSPPNEIKAAKCRRLTPLTEEELKLVQSLLDRYGQKWEVIQTFLPQRDTQYLPMLWREASQGQMFKRPGCEERSSQPPNRAARHSLIRTTLLDTSERGEVGYGSAYSEAQAHGVMPGILHLQGLPGAAGSTELQREVPASLQDAIAVAPAASTGANHSPLDHRLPPTGCSSALPSAHMAPLPLAAPSHGVTEVPASSPACASAWHNPSGCLAAAGNDAVGGPSPMSAAPRNQSQPCGPDAAMVVEGRVTTWTQQDDRRILLDVRRCGECHSTFQQLATAVGWDARAVEARYHWLCRRLALSTGPTRR